MELGLACKVALITGGSKGIGFACAALLHEEGARVAICSRSKVNLAAAQASIGNVFTVAADLRRDEDALRVVEAVENEMGPIDILVNSAGAATRHPPDELSPAKWRAAIDAKFFTYVNIIDPLVKRMAQRGTGVIVNIIGSGGKVASPTHIAGGAANAALMLATAGLANAYARRGVRVLGVNPGLTATDRVQQGLESEARLSGISVEEAQANSVARIPMGRMADAVDIARMVAFLASNAAAYVTGVTVAMDGSLHPVI
jgi:NAD(P)-dependent dehydrogenase (short-subunit alcohol dehydrogenase family)